MDESRRQGAGLLMVKKDKHIVIIAGPNGAGKTTFAREFLPEELHCLRFINADLIAAGLSPFAPQLAAFRAGRLMLEAIDDAVAKGESFAFETTLSGRHYAQDIECWQAKGYWVSLIFLSLESVEIAIARVAERVRQGGHDIPEAVIRRRFQTGYHHFQALYKPLVNSWVHVDNSGDTPVLKSAGGQ